MTSELKGGVVVGGGWDKCVETRIREEIVDQKLGLAPGGMMSGDCVGADDAGENTLDERADALVDAVIDNYFALWRNPVEGTGRAEIGGIDGNVGGCREGGKSSIEKGKYLFDNG